ncbi:MAG: adenylate kinase [Oscillospiraceae bacterium]|nr:adenylate kinase [Oscillospiraceae bacterium]
MERTIMVLIGAPGSGKGTASKRLKKDLGLLHVSTGDVLRENVKNGTELGLKAKSYMDAGGLVPDEVIIGMVKELLELPEASKGVIFDGFPRTISQAEALDTMLAEKGVEVTAALNIEVPFEEIEKRMANRRTCSSCGSIYSLDFNPPTVEGKCDCNGDLIQREDEKPEVVKGRLATYKAQSAPLVDYYGNAGNLYQDSAGDIVGKTTHQVVDEFQEFLKSK